MVQTMVKAITDQHSNNTRTPIGAISKGSAVNSSNTAASIIVILPEPPIIAAMPIMAYVPGSGMVHSYKVQ